MKIKALKRFNGHPAGEEFDADDKDAKKWIAMNLAEKAKGEPPEIKMVKGPEKSK